MTSQEDSSGFLISLTLLAAIGGFLFGYDTGVISGAMILLVQDFDNLTSVWQELIVSVTVGAAALFALIGGFFTDKFGRRPVILVSSAIFTVGAILMGAANGRIMLLVGRFTVGAGIGLSSMTGPTYIAEAAPAHLRGRLVTMNTLFITGGQFIASLLDGALSYIPHGWRYMLGLACVPAIIQFVGFLFMPESPRWLIKNEKYEEGKRVLGRIYESPETADQEFHQIKVTFDEERKTKHLTGAKAFLKMVSTPYLRRTLILGCSLQLFQQVTGINTIMYYSATIVKMAGVKDPHEEIWLAAAAASVNFVFTFLGLYLVEKIGRRLLTLISLAGVNLALLILAIGFQLMAIKSPPIHNSAPAPWPSSVCHSASSCNQCINMAKCGFCFNISSSPINGSCLLFNQTSESIYGECNVQLKETSAITWATNWCPTNYAWLIVLGLGFYLFCFAPGMGPMPWTMNAEIYPQWARSTGNACSTATNWVSNLIVSMTFLSLLESITKQGAYYLYTSIGIMGWIFFWWVLPETKGKTLEEVEGLFTRPWFCGRNSKLSHRDDIEYVSIHRFSASQLSSCSDDNDF